jgi:hypothetical protein
VISFIKLTHTYRIIVPPGQNIMAFQLWLDAHLETLFIIQTGVTLDYQGLDISLLLRPAVKSYDVDHVDGPEPMNHYSGQCNVVALLSSLHRYKHLRTPRVVSRIVAHPAEEVSNHSIPIPVGYSSRAHRKTK